MCYDKKGKITATISQDKNKFVTTVLKLKRLLKEKRNIDVDNDDKYPYEDNEAAAKWQEKYRLILPNLLIEYQTEKEPPNNKKYPATPDILQKWNPNKKVVVTDKSKKRKKRKQDTPSQQKNKTAKK